MQTATKQTSFEMIAVRSSNLLAIGYDPKTETLRIQFRDRGLNYDYANVPALVFEAFKLSESKGEFFTEYVKPYFKAQRV